MYEERFESCLVFARRIAYFGKRLLHGTGNLVPVVVFEAAIAFLYLHP